MSIETPSKEPVVDAPKSTDTTYDLLKETPDEKKIEIPEEDLKKEDDLLADDEEEVEPKVKKGEKEEDEEEPDEEEVEKLDTIEGPPRRKEILKKYPELFKDFPYLEAAYYREQKFTEMLGTIEDAQEIKERAGTLDKFEERIFEGNVDQLLSSVREADQAAFGKIVDNLLPNLAKVDQGAYLHIMSDIGKKTIIAMMNEANATANEDAKNALSGAANILHQFLFGSSQWTPPQTYGKHDQQNPEAKKLADEKAQFVQEKFDTAKNDLESRTNNRVKSTIAQHIDPKGQMTPYVRSKAIADCLDSLDSTLGSDSRFKTQLDGLWEKAFDSNFSRDSISNIEKFVLSKAKSILPDHIRKVRSEALNGGGKRSSNVEREDPVKPGRSVSNTGSSGSGKLQIPKGMSNKDFLMAD